MVDGKMFLPLFSQRLESQYDEQSNKTDNAGILHYACNAGEF